MMRRPLWPYLYWAFVGVLIGFGVVGILSIGIFVLAAALILTILGLAAHRSPASAVLTIIPGVGVLPLWVAVSNWGGPSRELLDPWPFGVFGALVLVGGGALVWFIATREQQRRSPERVH